MKSFNSILILMVTLFCVSCKTGDKTSEKTIQEETVSVPELDETSAVELIKMANSHNVDALSSELKSLWNEPDWDGNWELLEYGGAPDCVKVKNPDIKIFKMIPDTEKNATLVIFDFNDNDAPHMGWISERDYNKKACAMNFIYENDKWVVDDYLVIWNGTLENFNINEASSKKSDLKVVLD